MKKYLVIFFIPLCAVVFLFLSGGGKEESIGMLSDPTPISIVPQSVSILFVGDIMLARTVGKKIESHKDPVFPFAKVLDFLRKPDVTFGNLESVISDRGLNVGSIYSFRADPSVLFGLQEAGFDVLSVINNHSLDWGRVAWSDSASRLREGGIVPLTNDLSVIEKNGYRIGLYAFTDLIFSEGVSAFAVEDVVERIKEEKERERLDFVIVSMHWGDEYEGHANASQKYISHALVDGGVAIVVGHHPHVEQETELYRGSLIIYSLGNFVFDQYFSDETMRGLVVLATLSKGGVDARFFTSYLNTEYQVERIEERIGG